MQGEDAVAAQAPMEIEGAKGNSEEEKEGRFDWTAEADYYLKTMVDRYGPHNWMTIANMINSNFCDQRRTSKQCRERWCNKLDPTINHQPWTKEEEATLILSHMRYKNRWCDIVNTLKGRHNGMIKNRFYSIFRKVKNKVKTLDLSYNNKLELLEIYYMLSVMEDYAANPLPPDAPKRKRGKDFIYSLIVDLESESVVRYKAVLNDKCPLKESLENSLLNIAYVASEMNDQKMVSAIAMPPAENCEKPFPDLKPSFLRLPEPRSFSTREVLTPDEKEFVRLYAFNFATPPPSVMFRPPTPMQCSCYSANTGQNGFSVAKGGFAELSRAAGAQMIRNPVFVPQMAEMMRFPIFRPVDGSGFIGK